MYRIQQKLARFLFNLTARRILGTPPVRCDPESPLTIVSQVYPPDVIMFLIAAKTFARFVPVRRFSIVADRLEGSHVDVLRRHLGTVDITPIETIATDGLPTGGCWERLLHVIDSSQHGYVIQLDADTVTLRPPLEVIDCIKANRSFSLGTMDGQRIIKPVELVALLSRHAGGKLHIQVAAELALAELDDPSIRYVRGNAAFTGFATGAHSRAKLAGFSQRLQAAVGGRWHEWGSEQVASNLMVANSPDPVVLPVSGYRFFSPGLEMGGLTFVHFMGPARFHAGVYRRLAGREIAEVALCASPTAGTTAGALRESR